MMLQIKPGEVLGGSLIYDEEEYSFRYEADPGPLRERVGGKGVTSLAIRTLQIEVDVESGQALFAWGFHPKTQWLEAQLDFPTPWPGLVFFQPTRPFIEGVSVSINSVGAWSTKYDPSSGWVKMSHDHLADGVQIEIADGVVIGELAGELHSLWLRPLAV